MIFDRITNVPCIVPPTQPPDARCEDSNFSLQHPDLCDSALIIKPSLLFLCESGSVQFQVFEFSGGVETALTSGVTFTSSDNSVLVVGVNSGNATAIGTAIGSGQAIVTATYGDRTVQATITVLGVNCCDEITAISAILVDNSRSMTLGFGGAYTTRLEFAKAVAAAYGGSIVEVANVPKDYVTVLNFNETLTELLSQSQDTAAITAAVNGITQTQNKTELLPIFTDAAQDLLDFSADRRIIFLVSDCEQTGAADEQAILDAAFLFKQAGGIIIVVSPRASGNGFDLAERLATPGFFLNASSSTAETVIGQLSYLKKLLCAGDCVDAGDRWENQPALDYSTLLHWEVTDGKVNLFGPGLFDVMPGNGLYLQLDSSSHTVIRTIETFDLVSGNTYRINFNAAGNQMSESAAQGMRVYAALADGTVIFEQTVYPAWNSVFQEYNFSFTALFDATVRIYFEQTFASDAIPGNLLNNVLFKNETDLVTLLDDNFDGENLVYIPPACGASSAIDAIDDPGAPVITVAVDQGTALADTEVYTYSISGVTNEGETAATLCSVDPFGPLAQYDGTILLVEWPADTTGRVIEWHLWRSLGTDTFSWTGSGEPRYLLATLPAHQTSYLDEERSAAFTARYEASVTEPTVNTTAYAGGTYYYDAPCCYYYFAWGGGTEELIPTMTSNTEPSGIVSSGNNLNNESEAYRAVFGDFQPPLYSGAGFALIANPDWDTAIDFPYWQYQLTEAKIISAYRIGTGFSDSPGLQTAPKSWTLEASNNGTDWTTIDTQAGVIDWPTDIDVGGGNYYSVKTFSVTPTVAYAYYRLTVTERFQETNASEPQVTLNTFQLIGGGDNEILFENNCPPCIAETPGAQAPDSNPLPDIETGFTPPVIFTSTKTVCTGCPPGFTNAPTPTNNLVPEMTSATAPSGTVISSAGAATGYEAWKVFDRDDDTYMDLVGTISGYVGYHATTAGIATSYTLKIRGDYILSAPKAWTFEGSNDGSAWTVLDTRSNIAWYAGQKQAYSFANSTAYAYYRVNITTNVSGDSTSNLSLSGMEIFGTVTPTACGTATETSSVSQAHADQLATDSATAAALAQLSCVPLYTATRSYTASCPFGTYGPSVTKTATRTSLNSQAEADALAQAAAEELANAELVCTFSNNLDGITVDDIAVARPYPSVRYIAESGVIAKVTVAITGLTHNSPDDLRILLVSPAGTAVWLMKDCGGVPLDGASQLTNVNLVFDDDAAGSLPDGPTITSGSYQPTIYGGNAYPPSPASPQSPDPLPSLTLAAFVGEDRSGAWNLFVSDDLAVNSGSIVSWELTIT